MGQIKNIKLHIVTDIKSTEMGSSRNEFNKMWQSRWEEGRTGWHKDQVNPHLEEFFTHFTGDVFKKRILVPMCGKSVDLKWLYDKGMNVQGVELVEQPIIEFFAEQGLDYTVRESDVLPGCKIYKHGERMTLYVCDIFKVTVDLLGGLCEFLYDRAAIGAIEYAEKRNYTNVIQSVLAPNAQGLIESMLFDPAMHPCPPSSTSEEDIEKFYGRRFTVQVLSAKKSAELPDWYRSKAPGLDDASYVFYFIKSRRVQSITED